MRKNRWLLWILICSLIVPGTLAETKPAKKPKLSKTKLTLKVGAKKQLSIKNRRKFKIKKVTFTSSKTKVAKVTKKGKVKALRKGKATITCKVVMKNKKKYRLKCKVTVKSKNKATNKAASKSSAPAKTSIPSKPAVPSGTENPQDTIVPSGTGNPQDTTMPSGTGNPQDTTTPSGTGNPQDTTTPSGTGNPQNTITPSGSKTPVTENPTTVPAEEPVAVSRFTLPPAATFTPSPENVPKVSHLSKNGITTMDNGVMRDKIDAYDIVWDMGLGTNLGNTMESCGTWINPSSVTNFETAWGAPVTTQEMLTGMKAAGFSSIRIPVGWSNMMADDGKYKINEAYFNRVETIMNYAINEDMYVIINIHFDGGWWARFGSMVGNERKEAMKKFEEMWLQIANRFQEYSDYVIFESANEELGARLNSKDDYKGSGYFTSEDQLFQLTNIINQTFVNVVRSTGGNNARRFLLIAGYDTNIDLTCDSRYQMPEDNIDDHLMVSIHYYSPAIYCIAEDSDNSWGYSDTWGTDQDIATLKKELGSMRTHFVNKGYPVIIGEYGVCDSNIDEQHVRKNGRDLFFKTVCEYATENNMCPVLWDANQIFDRKKGTIINETEKENYATISQRIKATPVVKPDILKDVDIWSGKLGYSNWCPKDTVGNDSNTFSIKSVGGCFAISGIPWKNYEHPVIKMTYHGAGSGDALVCKFYNQVKEEQYWTSVYEDGTGLIATGNLKKGSETVIDLSEAKMSDTQKMYFIFSGVSEMDGEFTMTIMSQN